MMRWVLLACLAAMASAVSEPHVEISAEEIGKNYAIFLAKTSAEQTTTFTLKQTVIKITKHSAADSQALSAIRHPKIIVTDAAAKGLVCVPRGKVTVSSSGQVVESGGSSTSGTIVGGGSAIETGVEGGVTVGGGTEIHKSSEDLIVGQGGGVVASVSSAAAASGGGASSSAASGGGAAASSAAGGSGGAGGGSSGGSGGAGGGSAASSAVGGGSAASSAAGEGSAASSAAGGGSAGSSAAGGGSAASSAAGGGSTGSSASGDSSSSSSTSSGGEVSVDVSGGGEAAAYSGGEGVHLSGDGHASYIDERYCECVPDYLCDTDGYINTGGAGIIDIRSFAGKKTRAYASKCKVTETCCKHRDHEQIGWLPNGCGDRSPIRLDKRVIGGEASGLGKYPWMVAIILSIPDAPDQYVCGGSLIGTNVVLTGAHCVDKLQGKSLIVRVGEWDTCNNDELYPHQDIEVTSVVQHEAFNKDTLANDVALLTLGEHIEVSPHINPICLPDASHRIDINTHDCVSTGWGKQSFENSKYSNILKEVHLSVVDHDECQKALRTTRLGRYFKLHDTFMCAGGLPHVDTCKGDGGSPLVCRIPTDFDDEEKFVQVGIVAWGIGCGQEGIPGVYADVQKLLPWIQEHLPAVEPGSDPYP